MTIKGKRKALENNPLAQIEAIKHAFGGVIPTKPLHRLHPAAAWIENQKYYIARLSAGKLGVTASETRPKDIIMADCPGAVCSYLSLKYGRKVGLLDLKAAENKHLSVQTLQESQTAVICWIKDKKMILQAANFNTTAVSSSTFEYCAVSVDGIQSGTTTGLPHLRECFPGPLIKVGSINVCINLLNHVFKLKVGMTVLEQSFVKKIKPAKIEPANTIPVLGDKNREGEKHE